MKVHLYVIAMLLALSSCVKTECTLLSPDGRTSVRFSSGEELGYSIQHDGKIIVPFSKISMAFDTDSLVLGQNCGRMTVHRKSVRNRFHRTLFYRQSEIVENYNEVRLLFDGWYLQVRAYNSGVAWRFVTDGCFHTEDVVVRGEVEEFNFPTDRTIWLSYSVGKDPYANAFQNGYTRQHISEFGTDAPIAFLPVMVECEDGVKAVICESDLESYPGMFIKLGENGLAGEFAALPDSTYIHPTRCQKKIASRKDIIAKTTADRTYPWRIVVISDDDRELPTNDLVYLLATPYETEEWSWVRPGLCAWAWWNAYGLKDAGFETGVNTRTYQEYIDFAARLGLTYVVVDEGWSAKDDIMKIREGIDFDLDEILSYAASKNVGIFLWAVANVLDDKLETACSTYSEMGVKGFKVDFFDRDDQEAVEMVYRICRTAAEHKLMVDLHGMYKPTGLNRTFPNAVNFEAVYGLEEVKWASPASVEYDVTFPFIRQIQGPSDYTQGAFQNATEEDFVIDYYDPMSKGTRTHQVAAYIVFDSPLAMLCDSPSRYLLDLPCAEFIASIPTVFDRTIVLAGEVGSYIVTAREKDGTWYVGALNNWEARDIDLQLTFLNYERKYGVQAMIDGKNADSQPTEYGIESGNADKNANFKLHLAKGGGAALIISPQ